MKFIAFAKASVLAAALSAALPTVTPAQSLDAAAVTGACSVGGGCAAAVRSYVDALAGQPASVRDEALAALAASLGELSTSVGAQARAQIVLALQVIAQAIANANLKAQVFALATTVATGNPGGNTAASEA